jgi:hypothetical protein
MEKFARLTALSQVSALLNDTTTHKDSSDNVVLKIVTVSKSTPMKDLVIPVNVSEADETKETNVVSRVTVTFPAASLSQLLSRNSKHLVVAIQYSLIVSVCLTDTSQLAVYVLVFNNLEEFMPTNTVEDNRTLLKSVGDLKNMSDRVIGAPIVSLSIVEAGEQYNARSAKLILEEPVRINYEIPGNLSCNCSFWEYGR